MRKFTGVGVLVGAVVFAYWAWAGSLEPPGPPGPTMVTLKEIDAKLTTLVASSRRFVGITASTTDGAAGWVEMSNLCRNDFGAEARMCSSRELQDSDVSALASLAGQAWCHPSIVGTVAPDGANALSGLIDWSGKREPSDFMSCFAWNSNSPGVNGLTVGPSHFLTPKCDSILPVSCCAP